MMMKRKRRKKPPIRKKRTRKKLKFKRKMKRKKKSNNKLKMVLIIDQLKTSTTKRLMGKNISPKLIIPILINLKLNSRIIHLRLNSSLDKEVTNSEKRVGKDSRIKEERISRRKKISSRTKISVEEISRLTHTQLTQSNYD